MLHWRGQPAQAPGILLPAGLAGLAYVTAVLPHSQQLTVGLALSTLSAGAVVLVAGTRDVASLRWGPLVAGGRMAYGLYLWRVPLVGWAQLNTGSPAASLVFGLGSSFVVALLSFHIVEQPFLRLKAQIGRDSSTVMVPAATALSAVPA